MSSSVISKNSKNVQEQIHYVHVKTACCIDVLIVAEPFDQVICIVDDEAREHERPHTPDHLLPDSPQRKNDLSAQITD